MSDEESSSGELSSEKENEQQQQQEFTTTTKDDSTLMQKIVEKNEYIKHLKRELRLIIIRNPHIKPFEQSELDSKLSELSVEELERILENIKIDLGVVKPCASGNLILTIVGTLMERFLGMNGFTFQLLENIELVTSVDSFLPTNFIQFGPSIKAAECFMSECFKYKKKCQAQEQQMHPN